MTTALVSILDAPDAIARMAALPAFQDRPPWARHEHDAAIGNWIAAVAGSDRVACARAALCAVYSVVPQLRPLPPFSLVHLAFLHLWVIDPREHMRRHNQADFEAHRDAVESDDVATVWLAEAAEYAAQTMWRSSAFASLAGIAAVRGAIVFGLSIEDSVRRVARAVLANELPADPL